ncbi:MAG: hypothetical protein ACREPT_11420, partial [Rudaea sp.]
MFATPLTYASRALVRRTVILLALVFFGCAWHSAPGADPAKPEAVAATPQFGGQCAEGLASGRHVMTDCSVTWTDKDGKVYCFSNEAAKTEFLKDTASNLERARNFMAASNVQST